MMSPRDYNHVLHLNVECALSASLPIKATPVEYYRNIVKEEYDGSYTVFGELYEDVDSRTRLAMIAECFISAEGKVLKNRFGWTDYGN